MIKTTYTAHAHTCSGDYDFPNPTMPNADIPSMLSLVRKHKPVVLKFAQGDCGIMPYSAINYIEWTVAYGTEDRPIDEFCGEEGFKVRFKDGEYYANVLERETNVFTLEISDTAINVSKLIATDNHEPVDLTGATLTVEGFTYNATNRAYVKSVQKGEYTDGQVINVNVTVTKGDYSGVAVFTGTVNA